MELKQKARKWLRSITRIPEISFNIRIGNREQTVNLDPGINKNQPPFHPWTRKEGWYKFATLRDSRSNAKREFRIYFGPWSDKRGSSYIVVFDSRKPILEVPLYTKGKYLIKQNGYYLITHTLAYPGVRIENPSVLHRRALKQAQEAKLKISDGKVELGRIRQRDEISANACESLIKKIIHTAYIKEFTSPNAPFRNYLAETKEGKTKIRRVLHGGNKGTIQFDINLEKRYGKIQRHEEIIDKLERKLEWEHFSIPERGFKSAAIDLAAEKGNRKYIFEVKTWNPKSEVMAAWHASGQLKWYEWNIRQEAGSIYKSCIVFNHCPSANVLNYMENYLDVNVLWISGQKLDGGPKARKELRELFR